MSVAEKCCTRCGETRPLDEFQRQRSSRDGRHSHCKPCTRAADRERRRRNAERAAEVVPPATKQCSMCRRRLPSSSFHRNRTRADGLQPACRDCDGERKRAWREKNADRERERNRNWREQNADRAREYRRDWYAKNADRAREYTRIWREQNADRAREYRRSPAGRAVARAARAGRRARQRDRACPCTSALAVDVLLTLGGCLYCGSTEDVTLEHVVALAAGGWDCLDNLAPACRSCNITKGDRSVEYLAERLVERGVEPLVATTEAALAAAPMPCALDLADEPEEVAPYVIR